MKKTKSDKVTFEQKRSILQNNIYGVDLDPKAVEIAQLNLLLKAAEKGKRLPMLENNIKCGNSLIDDEKVAGERAFKWDKEFPGIKFDVVVGNPPYVRIQTLDKVEVEFFNAKYRAAGRGNYDIYVLFVERTLNLLKKDGYLGFILPHKFFTAKYGEPIRKVISAGSYLDEIVHFTDQQVFEGATTYTCLLFLSKKENKKFRFSKVNDLSHWIYAKEAERGDISASNATASEWNFTVGEKAALFERLSNMPVKLGDMADIFVGLQTSADTVFLFKDTNISNRKISSLKSKELNTEIELETTLLKPVVRSGDIGRYKAIPTAVVLFPYNVKDGNAELISESVMKRDYPLTWEYLNNNKQILQNRESGKFKGPGWYQLYPKNLTLWEQPKILVPYMIVDLAAYYDTENLYFVNVTTGGFGITIDKKYGKHEYFTGLLNSRLLNWFLKNVSSAFHGGYFAANKQFLVQLPIRAINFSESKDKSIHDSIVKLVNRMLFLNKQLNEFGDRHTDARAKLEAEIKKTDAEIDDLVYKLYGITEKEKKIIEESLK
jgi:hypothetical protein